MRPFIYLIILVVLVVFISGALPRRLRYELIDSGGLSYSTGDAILMETTDAILMESGDKILVE